MFHYAAVPPPLAASPPRWTHPPAAAAGARAARVAVPAVGAAGADELAVTAAIARFEHQARMGSAEFAERYLRGEFGHAAWARVWFGLLE